MDEILLIGAYEEYQCVSEKLKSRGYSVRLLKSIDNIDEQVKKTNPRCIILESAEECPWNVIEVSRLLRHGGYHSPIILIAKNSSERLAIDALRAGMADYFVTPLNIDLLVDRIYSLHLSSFTSSRVAGIAHDVEHPSQRIVGSSQSIRKIRALASKYAQTNSNVLITGDTGTGKELVAKLIHGASRRHNYPMVSVNCAAIPESLLESELFGYERGAFTGAQHTKEGLLTLANKGTLFLDEIGEMTPLAQAKILRAIDTKVVYRLGAKRPVAIDTRIIAATNQDLSQLMEAKQFRKDLFFRLNVARIHLPLLKERREDIFSLCSYFLTELNARFGCDVCNISDELKQAMVQYDWPGNVRELKNVLEASFINQPGRQLCYKDLPEQYLELLTNRENDDNQPKQEERDKLLVALLATNWNKSKAAKKLNCSRMTLYRKMQKYRINERHEADWEQKKEDSVFARA